MMRPPSIHFGQGNPPRISINPQQGRIGQLFLINAINFNQNSPILIKVLNNSGQTVTIQQFQTNTQGSLGHANIIWDSSSYAPGRYTLEVEGTYKETVIIRSQTFDVFP